MDLWIQLYLAGVGALGIAGFLALLLRIRWEERLSSERMDEIRRWDAVRTEAPVEHHEEWARRRGHESVQTRFGLIRRTLVPLYFVAWSMLLALPFLDQLPATLVTLFAGALAVVVGITARPSLENLFAGIVISFTQPLRIGDTVRVDGHFGTVEDMTATHTVIKIWDWRRYLIPNSRLFEKEFINYSLYDRFQWAYVEFWVDYAADLDRVEAIAVEAARTSPNFAEHEPPRFWVMDLDQQAVKCWVAAWANTPSAAWALAHEVRSRLIRGLRDAGITSHTHRVRLDPDGPPAATASRGQDAALADRVPSPVADGGGES